VFAAGSFGFGGPTGSIEDVFHGLLVGSDSEDGLSAEELDGTYSYTASVEVGPHTLTSTAKVSVACA